MKHKRITDRGQVLIIFVFAVIGLIGMTGLAIDGGMIFSDRRQAQNAADTAALAGSVRKLTEESAHAVNCTVLAPTPSVCGAKVITAMNTAIAAPVAGPKPNTIFARRNAYTCIPP